MYVIFPSNSQVAICSSSLGIVLTPKVEWEHSNENTSSKQTVYIIPIVAIFSVIRICGITPENPFFIILFSRKSASAVVFLFCRLDIFMQTYKNHGKGARKSSRHCHIQNGICDINEKHWTNPIRITCVGSFSQSFRVSEGWFAHTYNTLNPSHLQTYASFNSNRHIHRSRH